MWLVADIVSWGMLLAGIVLLTVILMRRWSRYFWGSKRRKSQTVYPAAAAKRAAVRSLSDAPDDVLRWQVEMHETARTLKGELDSKMRLLQVLIRQAEEVAKRLETQLETSQQLGHDRQNRDQNPLSGEAAPSASDRKRQIHELAAQGLEPDQIARRMGLEVREVEEALHR
jgi:DNA-binding NarL/FixJ family response regulator